MVVVELQYSGRATLSSMEEEEVLEREREAPRTMFSSQNHRNDSKIPA